MANTLPPQYNVDEKTRLRLLEKANRRAQLREEFLKLRFDPFRHASGQGGYVVCIFTRCYVTLFLKPLSFTK